MTSMTDFRISLNDTWRLFDRSSVSAFVKSSKTSSWSSMWIFWLSSRTNVSDLLRLLMQIMGVDREINYKQIINCKSKNILDNEIIRINLPTTYIHNYESQIIYQLIPMDDGTKKTKLYLVFVLKRTERILLSFLTSFRWDVRNARIIIRKNRLSILRSKHETCCYKKIYVYNLYL